MIIKICRLCKSNDLTTVIDLGHHPLADTFLTKLQLDGKESFYPLRVAQCKNCGYLTSEYVVSAEERYQGNEYSYDSSNSPVARQHFLELADQVVSVVGLRSDDLAVDIGGNVGTLLKFLKDKSGCRIINVEPSKNIARIAAHYNTPTLNDFFNQNIVNQILKHNKKAKVIILTNVFNHLDNVDAFVENSSKLLEENGFIIIEVPYVIDLIEKTAFDTIYLEHVSYFSLKPHYKYFSKRGFYITFIEKNEYMGGSIRLYLSKNKTAEDIDLINAYCNQEEEAGVYRLQTYENFMSRVKKFKYNLCKKLYEIKEKEYKIIGIGAAAKGNTLLNYCKIDNSLLEFIAETSPLKIGKHTPGMHIKIIDEKDIGQDITHALILPWNISKFLKSKLSHLNVEFITPHMEEI